MQEKGYVGKQVSSIDGRGFFLNKDTGKQTYCIKHE